MPALADLDLPEFDYTDATLAGDRYRETLTALAAEHWIARSPLAAIVLDREAGEVLLRSKSCRFPGPEIAQLFGIDDGPLREEIDRNILHLDGEQHRRLRGLANPFFTPRAADRWRPRMRELLAGLWAPLQDAGRCDAVADLARPYPAQTIAAFMGAPLADAPRLHHWSAWIQRQFDPPSLMEHRAEIERAVAEFYPYCHALLEARRSDPRDDLVSALLAAEEAGDRLSDVECVNLTLNVLIGGVDTTQAQLGHALRLFATHPEQWALLAQDPDRWVAAAVREVLRYEPITPFTARLCLEDLTVRDVVFPAGSLVLVCSFTANQDGPFDITAQRSDRILTFGAGIHYCLGSNLATAELEEALRFLAPRMPGLRLDGEPAYGSIQGIYAMDALPVAWDA